MPYRYTDGEIIYLKFISKGKTTYEIAEIFNKTFGTNVTRNQIKSLMGNHKITSDIDRKLLKQFYSRMLNDEQDRFIRNNCKGLTTIELTKKFNEHFKTEVKQTQIKGYMSRYNITNGVVCRFQKGIIPVNKSKKGMQSHPNMIPTQFKKGQRPQNYMPVGSERVTTDGYVDIKVADPNKWRRKHHIVWEKHNGSIPQGYVVIFANGDKRNFDMDNLLLVTRKQLFIMNQNGLIKNDIELTKIGLSIANLHAKIKESEKKMKDL